MQLFIVVLILQNRAAKGVQNLRLPWKGGQSNEKEICPFAR
jgi:hypothetical protein